MKLMNFFQKCQLIDFYIFIVKCIRISCVYNIIKYLEIIDEI